MATQSSWLANGQPTHCAFEPCNKEFAEICFHAADGRYYCSEECAVEAANFRLSRIDNLGRRSHKALWSVRRWDRRVRLQRSPSRPALAMGRARARRSPTGGASAWLAARRAELP